MLNTTPLLFNFYALTIVIYVIYLKLYSSCVLTSSFKNTKHLTLEIKNIILLSRNVMKSIMVVECKYTICMFFLYTPHLNLHYFTTKYMLCNVELQYQFF